MKVLAIGDIHTKTWILELVEDLVDYYDHVVFCGDYADDYDVSAGYTLATWRTLKILMKKYPDKVHAVLGNHDYAYLHPQIAGVSSGFDPHTYTMINTPENKRLKNWLLSLPIVFELDGVTYSHAGVTEEWDGEFDLASIWHEASPIWARPPDLRGNIHYKKIPQVIGHNSYETCKKITEDVWCIDTFSTYPDGKPVGDYTVLEIIDGKEFNIKKLLDEHYNNTARIETEVS